MPMVKKERLSFKTTCVVLIFTFLLSDIAYAAPEISFSSHLSPKPIEVISQDLSRFEVPLDFSAMQEYREGDKDKPIIIHIQDAHSNYSGQQNLAQTLEFLIGKYHVS